MLADGTLDVYIASLLESKLRLINTIESEEVPNASVLDELYAKLRSLGPALLQENKALQATGEIRDRLEAGQRAEAFSKPWMRRCCQLACTNSKALGNQAKFTA